MKHFSYCPLSLSLSVSACLPVCQSVCVCVSPPFLSPSAPLSLCHVLSFSPSFSIHIVRGPNHQMIAACPQICATVCALQVISGSNVASLIKLTTLLSCKFLSCQTPFPTPHPQPRRTPPPPNTRTHFSHFMVTSSSCSCVFVVYTFCVAVSCQWSIRSSPSPSTPHPPL